MMIKADFKSGQTVYLRKINNAARYAKTVEDKIIEATVKTVGRKYITVEFNEWSDIQFNIENEFRQKTDYTASYELYLSRQDILDRLEKWRLIDELRCVFRWDTRNDTKLSLDALRRIAEIVKMELG